MMNIMKTSEEKFPQVKFKLKQAIPKGALLRVRACGVAMLKQQLIEEIRVSGNADPLPEVHRYHDPEMKKNWDWYISAMPMLTVQCPEELAAGTELEVSSSFIETDWDAAARYSGLEWTLALVMVDDVKATDFAEVADSKSILFAHGDADRLECYLKADGRIQVRQFDAFGNPAGLPASLTGKLPDGTNQKLETDSSIDLASLFAGSRISVTDDQNRTCISNPLPRSIANTPINFGEFHWHSDFSSDGQRDLGDALKSARDELGLDFAGPGDHISPAGEYFKGKTPVDQEKVCKAFDDPGTFCTIAGAELSRRYGHANIYADSFDTFKEITSRFKEELAPRFAEDPWRYGFEHLLKLCPPGKSLVIGHHTNMDSYVAEKVMRPDGLPYWGPINWPLPADREVLRLFEMVQTRGCFEAEEVDPQWKINYGGLGGSARTALMRGYRFGFVAGTDNHCGWPTRKGNSYAGVTAVLADSLDPKSIFQALYNRRCYATTGARIIADYTLNGHPMGSELTMKPGEERKFHIRVNGTAPLDKVQMIHLGFVLKDFEITEDSPDFEIEWSDNRPGRQIEDAYYYLRIRQKDGNCAWLSPFWIDLDS